LTLFSSFFFFFFFFFQPDKDPLQLYFEIQGDVPEEFVRDWEQQLREEFVLAGHSNGVKLLPLPRDPKVVNWDASCVFFLAEVADFSRIGNRVNKARLEELKALSSKLFFFFVFLFCFFLLVCDFFQHSLHFPSDGNAVLSVVYTSSSVPYSDQFSSKLSAHGHSKAVYVGIKRTNDAYNTQVNKVEAARFTQLFLKVKHRDTTL